MNAIKLNTVSLNTVSLNTVSLNTIGTGYKKKGSSDDFPRISGLVARYSAKGLTNEEMAANPVWKDLSGNGNDIELKNFAWTPGSGIGDYATDYTDYFVQNGRGTITVTRNRIHITSVLLNTALIETIKSIGAVRSYKIRVSGLPEGATLRYRRFVNSDTDAPYSITQDGEHTLPESDDHVFIGFSIQGFTGDCNIIIEQVLDYEGALVFDGVDDYGVNSNFPVFTRERGYTVVAVRQHIKTNGAGGIFSDRNHTGSEKIGSIQFEGIAANGSVSSVSFGQVNWITLTSSPFSYQTSTFYNSTPLNTGEVSGNSAIKIGAYNASDNQTGINVALYDLIIYDRDLTQEEIQKIKDYFMNTYPWMFPVQGWTVAGKTNDDSDRDTVRNITGNGNDLRLSNFAFEGGGSGYSLEGDYKGYLLTDGVDDKITSSNFVLGKDWTMVGDWSFIVYETKNSGIAKPYTFIYNTVNGYLIFVDGVNSYEEVRIKIKIRAITSNGILHFEDGTRKAVRFDGKTISFPSGLQVAHVNGTNFTRIAFKNLAFYDRILTQEECEKAYNWLQQLKEK